MSMAEAFADWGHENREDEAGERNRRSRVRQILLDPIADLFADPVIELTGDDIGA